VEELEDRTAASVNFTTAPAIPVLDEQTRVFLRYVLNYGAQLGNRTDVFMKAGDSITYAPQFMAPPRDGLILLSGLPVG
jgi:hypothetical protein